MIFGVLGAALVAIYIRSTEAARQYKAFLRPPHWRKPGLKAHEMRSQYPRSPQGLAARAWPLHSLCRQVAALLVIWARRLPYGPLYQQQFQLTPTPTTLSLQTPLGFLLLAGS